MLLKLTVPSLHERGDDIFLAGGTLFLSRLPSAGVYLKPLYRLIPLKFLSNYSFPGNVRELEKYTGTGLALLQMENLSNQMNLQLPQSKPVIKAKPFTQNNLEPETDLIEDKHSTHSPLTEKEKILEALNHTRWNRTAAARDFGYDF